MKMLAEIWIGGSVPAELVDGFCAAIRNEVLSTPNHCTFFPEGGADLLKGVTNGVLHLHRYDVPCGRFVDLERFLVANRIEFSRRRSYKYDEDISFGSMTDYVPNQGVYTYPIDSEGQTLHAVDLRAIDESVNNVIVELQGVPSIQKAYARLQHLRVAIKKSLLPMMPSLSPFAIAEPTPTPTPFEALLDGIIVDASGVATILVRG